MNAEQQVRALLAAGVFLQNKNTAGCPLVEITRIHDKRSDPVTVSGQYGAARYTFAEVLKYFEPVLKPGQVWVTELTEEARQILAVHKDRVLFCGAKRAGKHSELSVQQFRSTYFFRCTHVISSETRRAAQRWLAKQGEGEPSEDDAPIPYELGPKAQAEPADKPKPQRSFRADELPRLPKALDVVADQLAGYGVSREGLVHRVRRMSDDVRAGIDLTQSGLLEKRHLNAVIAAGCKVLAECQTLLSVGMTTTGMISDAGRTLDRCVVACNRSVNALAKRRFHKRLPPPAAPLPVPVYIDNSFWYDGFDGAADEPSISWLR